MVRVLAADLRSPLIVVCVVDLGLMILLYVGVFHRHILLRLVGAV